MKLRSRTFKVNIAEDEVLALAERLAGVSVASVQAEITRVVNDVAERAYEASKRRILSGVNLPESYVEDRLILDKARLARVVTATIRAPARQTLLSRFDPKLQTRPVLHPKRSKGYARYGIPPGQKPAGVNVTVVTGAGKHMPGAFLMPLRSGRISGGRRHGVFLRTGKGKGNYRHLVSLSVYQMFRRALRDIEGTIADDLRESLTTALTDDLVNQLEP